MNIKTILLEITPPLHIAIAIRYTKKTPLSNCLKFAGLSRLPYMQEKCFSAIPPLAGWDKHLTQQMW